ncbi:MAG: lytic transglycosylase domain-containing protein [Paludibacteraceae bacterium]|nr:lytic transglycosylase domain-containing protein [Paludibacteraceae bacterium]MBR6105326.1 lytic transglycosylase domain-containing protein [Paludibacteraceae bacterium]
MLQADLNKALIIGLTAILPLTACAKEEPKAPNVQQVENKLLLPEIPTEAEWCGEKLAINNEYYRERLDRELMNFTYSHSSTLQLLKRANRYFPLLERVLKEEGMPDDLKYLAAIESSLNPRSYSPAKAAGMWQMVPSAAKEFGLQVDEHVDERYNIELETRAACKYLRHAYELLGTWNLAAASYNTGIGRVVKQKKVQLADNFYEMNLMEETNRYVFRLLAVKLLFKNPKAYGFDLQESDLYHEVPCDTIGIDTTIENLAQFARERGLNYNLLKEENAWLRSNTLPNPKGKHFVLRLPILNDEKKR